MRFLRAVSIRLNKHGERLRQSERAVALASAGAAQWEFFATLLVPMGVAVVIGVISLGGSMIVTVNLHVLELFQQYSTLLLVFSMAVIVWIIWAAHLQRLRVAVRDIVALRAAHRLDLGTQDSTTRRRIRARREMEDGFVFPPH